MSESSLIVLLLFAYAALPFIGGIVVDTSLGAVVRWWRWYYGPLVVALAGCGLLGWIAAQGHDPMGADDLFVSHNAAVILFYLPVFVLIPTVLFTVGVGARRLLGIWVADERERQHEVRERMLGSGRPGSGGSSEDG
jgi:hypothetical protein